MGSGDDHTDVNSSASDKNKSSVGHNDHYVERDLDQARDSVDVSTKRTKLEHPVEDVEDLLGTERFQYLLREAQVDGTVAPGDRSDDDEYRVEEEFDRFALNTIKKAFQFPVTSVTRGGFAIADRAVFALVLRRVRAASRSEFATHLAAVPEAREAVGVEGAVDESRIMSWETELTGTDETKINECATRVLYAVYRSGQAFPQQVWDRAVASPDAELLTTANKETIDDGKVPSDVSREALRNWARAFLTRCVQGEFSLDRDVSQTKYSILSFVGVFAHAALQSRPITGACKTCTGWVAPTELVPDRTTVMNPVKQLTVNQTAGIFQEFNQRFLEFASEYSILDGPKQTAFDPTSITQPTENPDDRFQKGYTAPMKGAGENTSDDRQVEIGLAGVTEPDIRFALGMYPIEKKEDNAEDRETLASADIFGQLMSSPWRDPTVSINMVVMDRGLNGAEMVSRCRTSRLSDWIIHTKDEDEVSEVIDEWDGDEPEIFSLETYFKTLDSKPNVIIGPIPKYRQRGEKEYFVFLTDIPPDRFNVKGGADEDDEDDEDDEYDWGTLVEMYGHRARIENTIQQIKYDFDIPSRGQQEASELYFYLNMSAVFFNLHNLIGNSLSPEYGLPLGESRGASHGEVLTAIRDVAFELAETEAQ